MKNTIIFIFAFMLLASLTTKAQYQPEWEFGHSFGDYTGENYGNCIVTDDSGNYFHGGYFKVYMFLPNSSSFISSAGDTDGYIIKSDINGNYLWHKQIGSAGSDNVIGTTIDDNGDIYICGYFENTIDLGNGITLNSDQSGGMFIAKIQGSDGTTLWAEKTNGDSHEKATDIALDNDGNIYVIGGFILDATFGGTTTITSAGGYDMFLAKYNNAGDFQWVKQAGGTEDEAWTWDWAAADVYCNSTNEVYVTCQFESPTVTFSDLTVINKIQTELFPEDSFIARFSTNGDLLNTLVVGGQTFSPGTAGTKIHDIKIDSQDNIYICGVGGGDVNLGNDTYTTVEGIMCCYIAKYNNLLEWQTERIQEPDADYFVYMKEIKIDENDSIFVVGSMNKNIDFGNGVNLTGVGYHEDPFVINYDTNLDAQWATILNSIAASDWPNNGEAIDVNNSSIYITGNIKSEMQVGDFTINNGNERPYAFVTKTVSIIDPPVLINAVVSEDGQSVEASFDKEMNIVGEIAPAGFSIDYMNKTNNPIVNIALVEGDNTTMIFTLTNSIVIDQTVTLSYTPGTIQSSEGGFLEEIINEPVTNNSIITSVKQISNNNNNIYPNPSCGYFTITNNEFTITNVEITDITGRTIYNSQPVTRNSQFAIDISDQPKGIYFINITCEDQIQTKTEKIIIK